MAEQLALQQVAVDRPAVDDDERAVGARALAVDRARGLALAGAGLALEQHRGVALGRAREHGEGGPHRRRDPGERAEARLAGQRQAVDLGPEVEAEHRLAEAQEAAGAQERLEHVDAVEHGAVAALQVAHAGAGLVDHDLAVEPRDRRIVDDAVVAAVGADRAAIGRGLPGRAGGRPLDHGEAEAPHAGPARLRLGAGEGRGRGGRHRLPAVVGRHPPTDTTVRAARQRPRPGPDVRGRGVAGARERVRSRRTRASYGPGDML
nr:hypothetical protein [Nannocystis pusilla]